MKIAALAFMIFFGLLCLVSLWLLISGMRHERKIRRMREETDAKSQRRSGLNGQRSEKRAHFLP